MLVLLRKDGQTIIVGDVVIALNQARRGRAKISIDAPAGTPIVRGELVAAKAEPELQEV